MYLIDTSNSVQAQTLNDVKDFIRNEVNMYSSSSEIAIINFGFDAELVTGLSTNKKAILNDLTSMQKIGGERRTDKALDMVNNKIFHQSSKMNKLVVIFSTGNVSMSGKDYYMKQLKLLQERNIRLLYIEMGLSELVLMVSNLSGFIVKNTGKCIFRETFL